MKKKIISSYKCVGFDCHCHVIQGNKDVLWGLLLAMKVTYMENSVDERCVEKEAGSVAPLYPSLPYTKDQLRMLSTSLVQWLERKVHLFLLCI